MSTSSFTTIPAILPTRAANPPQIEQPRDRIVCLKWHVLLKLLARSCHGFHPFRPSVGVQSVSRFVVSSTFHSFPKDLLIIGKVLPITLITLWNLVPYLLSSKAMAPAYSRCRIFSSSYQLSCWEDPDKTSDQIPPDTQSTHRNMSRLPGYIYSFPVQILAPGTLEISAW